MVKTLLRVVLGFVVGCFSAGLTLVLFVLTPSEIAGLPPDVAGDRIAKAFELAVFVSVQAAIFSAPFALVAVALGEIMRNREWTFYAGACIAIAVLGFMAQRMSEQVGQPTIVNNYALTAFLTAGFVAGLVYWMASGRLAGGPPRTDAAPGAAAPAIPSEPTATKS